MKTILSILTATTLGLCSCRSTSNVNVGVPASEPQPMPEQILSGSTEAAMPKGVIYRMNGDCADLVPVTLTTDGGILSYPAPSDLNPALTPMPLTQGWYLDRRGIGRNSVFTTYTYSEYAALKAAPSLAELQAHICRDCRVTELAVLPMALYQAEADTAAVNALIRNGLPGCERIRTF